MHLTLSVLTLWVMLGSKPEMRLTAVRTIICCQQTVCPLCRRLACATTNWLLLELYHRFLAQLFITKSLHPFQLPETVNGRAAMIGVLSGLAAEFSRNVGLKQQIFEAPGPILATFVLIAVASAVPVFR